MMKITDMTSVVSVPVRTRLPLGAWALAGLVTLFSLGSSLAHLSASEHATLASLAQAAGLAKSDCVKATMRASALH